MTNQPSARPALLCFSRSYLSRLIPAMEARDPGRRYLHIVQTESERRFIEAAGGEVVLSLEGHVRSALASGGPDWIEPADFREVTEYPWCPIAADRHLPNFPPATRSIIAGAVYSGLQRVFQDYAIDAVVSEPVALFSTHCLFYLARKHDAHRLFWANAWFPDWMYFADSIHISKPVKSVTTSEEDRAILRTQIAAYLDGVRSDRRGPAYHPSFVVRQPSLLPFFKQRRGEEPLVVQEGWLSRAIQTGRYLRASALRMSFPRASDFMTAGSVAEHRDYLRFLSTSRRSYDALPAEYNADNLVYPLQYEPEASLLYFAPDFRDQTVVVENILRALPQGRLLWVKEHPNQFGALGTECWQALRRKYPALRFVHGRESVRRLIKLAGEVVTISSSAGMDGLALGRRVIVLGAVYFRGWPGTLPVSSFAELAQALNAGDVPAPADNRDVLLDLLQAIGERCYPGDPQPRHDLFSDENLDRLVHAVEAECEHRTRTR